MHPKTLVALAALLLVVAIGIIAYLAAAYPTIQPMLLQTLGSLLLVLVGALVGGLATWPIQRRSLMFEHRKDLIERIYAPLFDELTAGQSKLLDWKRNLEKMDRKEWNRIQDQHLSHWIEPAELKGLLTEIYTVLEGRLVTSASTAQKTVTSALDTHLRSIWRGPETFAVQVTPASTETTAHYYQSRPFQQLIGPGLFRTIALDEHLPPDANLLAVFNELKKHMNNPQVTSLDVIVDAVRTTLREDTAVKEFKSLFKTCSEKINDALRLLQAQLNP